MMFPPASPMGERVRIKQEFDALERQAIWNAHFRQNRRRSRLPNLFSFLKHKTEKRVTAAPIPVNAECEPC